MSLQYTGLVQKDRYRFMAPQILGGFSKRFNDNSEVAYFLLGHPVVKRRPGRPMHMHVFWKRILLAEANNASFSVQK